MPGVKLWGEAGLALFSARLHDNLDRHIQAGKNIWLVVPDFRFGIEFFRDHADFSGTGMFVSGYGMIKRDMITPERDAILYQNATQVLDYYVARYGLRIKFIFWCLAVRELRNRITGKYTSPSGSYRHPIWNYQDLLARYKSNTVDIWPITHDFDSFIVDQQGHPSTKGMAFIYHAFRLGNGESAYDLVHERYPVAIESLFMSGAKIPTTPEIVGAKAIEGSRGYLFLDGDTNRCLDQHYGRLPLINDQMQSIGQLITERREFLDARGIKQVVLVVPDKNVVYYDLLPNPILPHPERPAVRYIRISKDSGVNTISALPMLQEARGRGLDVYDSTDSHWNGLGAFAGYEALINCISNLGIEVTKIEQDLLICEKHFLRGDLGIKTKPERLGSSVTCRVSTPSARLLFENSIIVKSRKIIN